ncbi:MAG: phosphomannomutase [Deltaproteobacteria bacterium]|nr:phosphomannomutase [Deltaproteobacteria bacterium]
MRIAEQMERSGVRFGTSGARGLVRQMTDRLCYAYTLGFLQYMEGRGEIRPGDAVALGGDLRPSTDRIVAAAARAASDRGYRPIDCGRLPTPALALFGLQRGAVTVMVTGSHIPADRNGIKYTRTDGEILKEDEAGIRAQDVSVPDGLFAADGALRAAPPACERSDEARALYAQRYLDFFGAGCLAGQRVGVYLHSAAGRDLFVEILSGLGAEVTALGRSQDFVAVDTEAIRPADVESARAWAAEHGLEAIVSSDGDSDRPMVADERGIWMRGDVCGILCAAQLGADAVVAPVSCNTALERCGLFAHTARTRIGSPWVIEKMRELARAGAACVVGYEANGGFLLGSDVERDGRRLAALPTRDAVLVHVLVLLRARERGLALSRLRDELPARFTYSDRLVDFPQQLGFAKLDELHRDRAAVEALFGGAFGPLASLDSTDGLRITFAGDEVIHLRPSGNAPEFRCYTEADSEARAMQINQMAMDIVRTWR